MRAMLKAVKQSLGLHELPSRTLSLFHEVQVVTGSSKTVVNHGTCYQDVHDLMGIQPVVKFACNPWVLVVVPLLWNAHDIDYSAGACQHLHVDTLLFRRT